MKPLRHTLLLLLMALSWACPLPLEAQSAPHPLRPAQATPRAQASSPLTNENSTLQRIRNRGNLMIAGVLFDYRPFGYLDAQGEITGFEVDLIRAIAEEWAIDVQFMPVTPSTRLQSLVAGQVDLVAAAMPDTTAAEAHIDFSQSYFTDTPALLVRSITPTSDLMVLANKTIAAIQSDEATTELQTALAAAATTATIIPFQEYAPAVMALKAGQADALLADRTYLTQVAQTLPLEHLLLPLSVTQTYGIGVAQGDAYFRNLIDTTLVTLQERGVFSALYAKWFPERTVPRLEELPGQWPYTFATSPSDLALPTPSRLRQIQTRGKLLVGVAYDFAPFGFLGDDGQPRGFDVDLSRELARRWLGNAGALELVRVTPATAIPLLMAGQVDLVAAALPLTWANRAQIDFSQSYFYDGQSILTRADSTIQTLADLDQKLVAVVGGSNVNDLTTLTGVVTTATLAPTLLPFQELRAAQQALQAGQVDALIGSSVALSQTVQSNPDLRLIIDGFVRQPYALGIPLFDAELRDQVNLTLQAMQDDGTYPALYERWFAPTPPLVTAPAASPERTGIIRQTLAVIATALPLLAADVTPSSSAAGDAVRTAPILQPTATLTAPALNLSAPILIATSTAATAVMNADPTGVAGVATVTLRPGIKVNARRAPTATGPIVEVLEGGTTWPLLAVSPDGTWIEVQLAGKVQAWVAAQLILQPATAASTQVPMPPTVTPTSVASAPPPTPTPPLLFTTPLTHRVNAADTLATIAKQYYGNQGLWQLIYEANRDRIGADPNAIPVGAELVIPPPP